jgi:hypothetical protein
MSDAFGCQLGEVVLQQVEGVGHDWMLEGRLSASKAVFWGLAGRWEVTP